MIEVKTSTDGKALIVHSEYSLERLTPAAALELAARLREAAAPLLPPVGVELWRCTATTRDGTRCLFDTGHDGHHHTVGGWFKRDGDYERPLEAKR